MFDQLEKGIMLEPTGNRTVEGLLHVVKQIFVEDVSFFVELMSIGIVTNVGSNELIFLLELLY